MREESFVVRFIKRLLWDLLDPAERQYWGYYLFSGVPGLAGNMIRGRYIGRRCRSAGKNLQVFAGARFRSVENLVVGDDVEIGYDVFIQSLGGVTIGDHVMLAPGVKIWSVNHGFRDKRVRVRDQKQTLASVCLGNDVWVASSAFISPGVTLPDGVVVSAGAVVGIKEYRPYSILAGNPARIIGYREEE